MGTIAELLNKQTTPEQKPKLSITQMLEQNKPPRLVVQEVKTKIQSGKSPSRKDMESLGVSMNRKRRKEFADNARRIKLQPSQFTRPPETFIERFGRGMAATGAIGAGAITAEAQPELVSGFAKGFAKQTQIPALLGKEIKPTPEEKVGFVAGQFAESIAELLTAAKAFKLAGIGAKTVLGKAGVAGAIFGTQRITEEARKLTAEKVHGIDAEYEGALGITKSIAFGALFSLGTSATSAVAKAIWKRLTPAAHKEALKLLGLKRGASIDAIRKAGNKLAAQYHPDKVAGMRNQFEKAIQSKETLIKAARARRVKPDIIRRGAVSRGTLLPGQVPPGAVPPTQAIQPTTQAPATAAQPPVPARTAAGALITPTTPQDVQREGVEFLTVTPEKAPTEAAVAPETAVEPSKAVEPTITPVKAKQPWEMTREEYHKYRYHEHLGEMPTREVKILRERDIKEALSEGKPVPRAVLEEYKSEKWAQEALAKAEVEGVDRPTGFLSATIAMGMPEQVVPFSAKEKLNITGAAFLLDDGTIIKGEQTHIQLAIKVPRDRTVVDTGFVDEDGNYIRREDALAAAKAGAKPKKGTKTIKTSIGNIEIPSEDLDVQWDQALEVIFNYGNQQAAGKPNQPDLTRSLSMGDTVEYEGKNWLLMPTGWQDVSQLSQEGIDKLVGPAKIPVPPKQKPKKGTVARKVLDAKAKQAEAERDILGGQDPIMLINRSLKEAVEIRPLLEAERKAEKRRRVGAAAGTLKTMLEKGKLGAEEAIIRSKGLLKGKLSGLRFEPIRGQMEESSPGAVNGAFNSIATNKELRYFEVTDTQAAFTKLIDGEPITLREVDMIRRQFGNEMGDIAKLRTPKSSLSDRAYAFWRAGLLTGLKTSMLNVNSTLVHSMMEVGKDTISAPVDIIASWFTGKRHVGFTVRGIPKGVKQGAKEGWDYLRTGIDKRHIGEKYDWNPVNFGDSMHGRALQTYVESMFHLMGAEDQPFFYGAMSRSLRSQAIAQARNQKLKGKEFNEYVDKVWNNPTEEMLDNGTHDAEMAVFQNRTVLGDIARAMQQAPVIRWAVPFSRTPSAVAMQIINYTPIGGIKEVMAQIAKKEFNQRNFVHAIARSLVSTPILAIGAALFAKGLMNLDYPDNERERKLWELEGRKPNSIKIGDKWRSAYVLGPAGNVLLIGGYFQQALQSSGSPSEAIITAMAGGAKSFTDQTFVVGMSRAVDAIKDPERSFESFFSSMAGSFVPTLLADFANAQDTMNRRTKGAGERIVSRIPFARRTLEPRIDVFGQDLPRYGGNPLEVMIDASRPAKIRQDIVVDEIRRLWENNLRISPTQLGNRDGYKSLTAEENTILWRQAGKYTYKRLFDLIRKPLYKGRSDEHKAKKFVENITKAKNRARAEIAKYKLAQGVELRDIRDLVTEDVAKLIGKSGEYSRLLREIKQGKL